ncbi:hypothetical protein KIM372_12270 [Bombiscardovia nodaiensis]|uniref:DivIVA domain-containing protein n=1 Tax=Bombiscardovia nodaiensis TaxID=2932181 RepID=A0ABN6SEX7_9BIFI|nr:hypothetical protein KIM372_12270 [Bombiscardovia nodaiensis]
MKLAPSDIGNICFDLRKNGYTISQVDAALARLERAVSDRRISWQINQYGQESWIKGLVSAQQKLAVHAMRAERERFSPGRSSDPSYDRRQVDRLVDQIVAKTASQLNLESADAEDGDSLADITAERVSNVIFTQRRGSHGYDERQVDYYMVKAVELLQQLESYVRLGLDESAGSARSSAEPAVSVEAAAAQVAMSAPVASPALAQKAQEAEAVEDTSAADTVVGIQPPAQASPVSRGRVSAQPADSGLAEGEEDQFDQLHQAEQAIFDGGETADAPALTPPVPAPKAGSHASKSAVPAPAARSAGRTSSSGASKAASVPAAPPAPAPAAAAADSAQEAAADVAQGGSSLAALAKAAARESEDAQHQTTSSVKRGKAADQSAQSAPAPAPVPAPAPLEETTQFNPLTDWDDETGSDDSTAEPTPQEAPRASAPAPASRQPSTPAHTAQQPVVQPVTELDPEETLISMQLPEVDVDIPDLAFPSFESDEESDETKQ